MRAWENFTGNLPPRPDDARASVVRLYAALPAGAPCLSPDIAAAALEDVRTMRRFPPTWASQALIDAGCNLRGLFSTYLEFLRTIAETPADRSAVVCSLLRMASAGVGRREDIPEGAVREAMSDTASPFYEDAKSLVEA